jgi:hypothetical protein
VLAAGTIVLGPIAPFGIGLIIGGVGLFVGMIRDGITRDLDRILRESAGYGVGINWHIDPSGYVYEAVTSNRIEGVTATAWWIEPGEDDPKQWDSTEYEQDNPLYTDYNGRYAWDTPEGMWQVRFKKDGYEPAQSEWLPVPPPQTEVNVGMISLAPPGIAWFNAYDAYAEVEFTKYMKPETVNGLALKSPGGDAVVYTLEYATDEQSLVGTVYAKRYKLVYAGDYTAANGTYTLTANTGIQSYAGVSAKQELKTAEFEMPLSLTVPETVQIEYGKSTAIDIKVENYSSAKPVTLSAESDFGFIADAGAVSEIGSGGSATVTVNGILPGEANIIVRIAEKGIEKIIPVKITMPSEAAGIVVSPAEVNVDRGETYQFTATDEATQSPANVVWSVSGGSAAGTAISSDGLLTVAADETAETLTVSAVDADTGERSATAIVHVGAESTFILGDVNGVGGVNMQDVLLTYQYIRGKATFTAEQLLAANVNREGPVNMQDVLLLYQYVRGKVAAF